MATLGKNDFIRDGKAYVSKNGKYAGKTRFAICELMIKNKERFVEGKTSSGRKLTGISIEGKLIPILSQSFVNQIQEIKQKLFLLRRYINRHSSEEVVVLVVVHCRICQCYYCSLAFNVKRRPITSSDITDKNMEKTKVCTTIRRYKAFKDRCIEDWLQSDTFIKSANAVYLKYKNKVQVQYTFKE